MTLVPNTLLWSLPVNLIANIQPNQALGEYPVWELQIVQGERNINSGNPWFSFCINVGLKDRKHKIMSFMCYSLCSIFYYVVYHFFICYCSSSAGFGVYLCILLKACLSSAVLGSSLKPVNSQLITNCFLVIGTNEPVAILETRHAFERLHSSPYYISLKGCQFHLKIMLKNRHNWLFWFLPFTHKGRAVRRWFTEKLRLTDYYQLRAVSWHFQQLSRDCGVEGL